MPKKLPPGEAPQFEWSISGKLLLELILREIEINGKIRYAQEILGNSPAFTAFIKDVKR